MDFKAIRDRIQKRYGLDIATASEIASDLIKDDFRKNKIKTMDEAMRFLDHLEEIGK